eukprot:m.112266 g.112266  ORF g.112266 m.112266 type:complete len:423 (-) comp16171_c0_seq2:141-1409(-)
MVSALLLRCGPTCFSLVTRVVVPRMAVTRSNVAEDLRRVELLDGGTGEELFANGVPDDRKIWSATAVVNPQYHEQLKAVHRSFIESGSFYVTVNNYGITPGVGFTRKDVLRHTATAARLAKEARDEAATHAASASPRAVRVMGSLPPLVESYRPDKVLPRDQGVALYSDIARALQPAVDGYLAETLSSIEEATQALLGATKSMASPRTTTTHAVAPGTTDCTVAGATADTTGARVARTTDTVTAVTTAGTTDATTARSTTGTTDAAMSDTRTTSKIVFVSLTLGNDGTLRSGECPRAAVRALLNVASPHESPLRAVLFNCSEPEAITKALQGLAQDHELGALLRDRGVRLGAYANRLTPVAAGWSLAESDLPQPMRDDLGPDRYLAEFVQPWLGLGVTLVGGCCGIGPEHIAAIARALPPNQ